MKWKDVEKACLLLNRIEFHHRISIGDAKLIHYNKLKRIKSCKYIGYASVLVVPRYVSSGVEYYEVLKPADTTISDR